MVLTQAMGNFYSNAVLAKPGSTNSIDNSNVFIHQKRDNFIHFRITTRESRKCLRQAAFWLQPFRFSCILGVFQFFDVCAVLTDFKMVLADVVAILGDVFTVLADIFTVLADIFTYLADLLSKAYHF